MARASAVLCTALFALRILPSLLAPGPPPPLAADIGLPHLRPTVPACRVDGCGTHRGTDRPLVNVWPAKALVRERPRRRRAKAAPKPRAEPAAPADEPAPTDVASPTPAPVAPPGPAPYSPPSPPGDGSMEFAPH